MADDQADSSAGGEAQRSPRKDRTRMAWRGVVRLAKVAVGVIGPLGGIAGLWSFHETRTTTRQVTSLEVQALIAKATDEIGGMEGTTAINFPGNTSVAQRERAWRHLSKAEALDPTNLEVKQAKCTVWSAEESFVTAEACWRDVIRRAPKPPLEALALLSLGGLLSHRGRAAEALPLLERSIALEPHDWGAYVNLSSVYAQLKRWNESLEAAENAVGYEPASAIAQARLADTLLRMGRFDAAQAHALEAIRLDPQESLGHESLGLFLAAKGRVQAAVESYARAIATDPAHTSCFEKLDTLGQYGKGEEELRTLNAAIADDRTAAHAYVEFCYYQLGRLPSGAVEPSAAVDACQKAVSLRGTPYNYRAYELLGTALQIQGRTNEAIAALRHGLELDPRRDRERAAAEQLLKTLER